MKNAFHFLIHIIDSFKLAFFQYNYRGFGLKFGIFRTLVGLIWKSKFHQNSAVYQDIFGFKVSAKNPQILYQLYREIFLDRVYFFDAENNEPKIIDAGANIGLSVLYFKFLYPKAKIIAIEPDPTAFKYLEENISQNRLQGVEVIQACVSDEKGKEKLYLSDNLINSSLFAKGEGITVDAVCLSDLLKIDTYDLVKVDIEGAETKVFQDLIKTGLYGKSKQYILEYHQGEGMEERLNEILKFFEENGFSSKVITFNQGEVFRGAFIR